jgi:ectoine utilization protein EutC
MKNPIVVLNESEIRGSVSLNIEAMEEIKKGFTALAKGDVTLPPILRIDIDENHGEVDVKTAYIHDLDSFAIKIASGFFENPKLGLPSGSGMMVLVSATTGFPLAILLDNGYLTDVRTGLAGAIAADYLAPKEITTVGVIGSGSQARYQVRGLKLVRDFSQLMVFGIVEQEVTRYIEEMSDELGIEVIQAKDAETLVRESSVVLTTTPSKKPYLRADWLHPDLHITCMGADAEDKQEIFPEVFSKADLIACDKKSQVFRLGELHHAKDAELISEDKVIELGELTSGKKTGRLSEKAITICDLTGVGIQDTQIARLAYNKAQALGYGLLIE